MRIIECERPAKVGIDAPLGWPIAFVRAVSDPDDRPVPLDASRAALERRATDHWVHARTGKLPLSVTTDRIAYPAMRAAGLLAHLAAAGFAIDRSGMTGLVCETYPDPTLRAFGRWPDDVPPRASYKRAARDVRSAIMRVMGQRAPWLRLTGDQRELCVGIDHCLDARICAPAARAVERGLTVAPDDPGVAEVEGWIHLPERGALERLP